MNTGSFSDNKVEGIGFSYVPRTCERVLIDHWIKTTNQDAFKTSRDLIRKEGLLVGGSSGSIMSGALKFIKEKGW